MCLHQQLKFNNSLYNSRLVICFDHWISCGRHLEMWPSCVAVPDPTRSLSTIVSIKRVETGTTTHRRHILRWRPTGNSMIKPNRLAWTIYRNYQIWAADVHTSWGKLLFAINIIGKTRFLLIYLFKRGISSLRLYLFLWYSDSSC